MHRANRLKTISLCLASCALCLGISAAYAQKYPARPVRVIVPFAPGSPIEVPARAVGQKLAEALGQAFVIDNRAGAGGTLGAALVAKSPPDGYTIMVYSATFVANAHLYSRLPYHPLKDFIGITPIARLVGALTVHPSMPVRSTRELIALAKARPGQILYGSAGNGAFQHLATSHLTNMAGVNMTHVPYKGGAPAALATVAGEVQMLLTVMAEVMPYAQAGRLRAIAVTSEKRTTQYPDLPAIAETVKGYEFTSWFGTYVPAGTPRPIVDKLNAEIKKAVADPDVASKLSAQVLDPMYSSPEEFASLMKSEYDKYERVVKASGAHID